MNPINWMFGKRTQLIIEALAILALRRTTSENPMQAKEIFREGHIPSRYLEPSLQRLVKAGILDGVRGPKGGYRLTENWEKVSLAQVLEAIVVIDDEIPAIQSDRPTVKNLFDRLGTQWHAGLKLITLIDLVEET